MPTMPLYDGDNNEVTQDQQNRDRPRNPDGSPVTLDQMNANAAAANMAGSTNDAQRAAQAEAIRAHEARFQYGGNPGGAFEAANRYNQQGLMGQQRVGEQINYNKSDQDRNLAQYARGNQVDAMTLMANRAKGYTPSIAGMQARQDINRAVADQTSIAAGARGPAGLALAQQQQAANSAQAISGISQQAQIAAAQERERAEQAFFGAGSQIRSGDFQAGGMAAQQAQAQAAINAAQRQQNDQYQLGMTQAEMGVQQSQLGAQGQKVAIETGQAQAAAALAQQQSQYDSSRTDKWIGMGLGAAGTGVLLASQLWPGSGGGGNSLPGTSGASGGGTDSHDGNYYGHTDADGNLDPQSPGTYDPYKADGGPVRAGRPYIVGERGPEMIVPQQNAHVLTNEQTRGLVQPMTGGAQGAGEAMGAGLMQSADPRATAWDEGRRAAIEDIKKLSKKTPEELRGYGDDGLVTAVRSVKGDAWDEGRGAAQRTASNDGLCNCPDGSKGQKTAPAGPGMLRQPSIGEQYLSQVRGMHG